MTFIWLLESFIPSLWLPLLLRVTDAVDADAADADV